MLRQAIIIGVLCMLAACAGVPPPSVQMKELAALTQGHVRLSFSTDQLSRTEAQELLLLSAALVSQREGAPLFQFRSVSARGHIDELSGDLRYYDVAAVIDPLTAGEGGDDARKTYRSEGVIEFLGPKYQPLLPRQLVDRLSGAQG